MLAQIQSAATVGMTGLGVLVEVDISNGLPSTTFVGLPDASVREAKDRVRSALVNSGHKWPGRRVTINLAPAGLPKAGSSFDLAVAVGVLVADGHLSAESVRETCFFGEVGLDGSLRPVGGVLAAARWAARAGARLVCPSANSVEASLAPGARVHGYERLTDLVASIRSGTLGRCAGPTSSTTLECVAGTSRFPDLGDVRGQAGAVRALKVAAVGGFNILFYGPPGSGKTMLARRLPGILPPLNPDEALDVVLIQSLVTKGQIPTSVERPFRAPHHSVSVAALVGGGTGPYPLPGEVSLAHHGVLFLDELSLFQSSALDALRQPLEDGQVQISRRRATVTYPSRPIVVAAANPCPCGYHGMPSAGVSSVAGRAAVMACRCTDSELARYRRRLSGPLADRFDLSIPVNRPDPTEVLAGGASTDSAEAAMAVATARSAIEEKIGCLLSQVPERELREKTPLPREAEVALTKWAMSGGVSARRVAKARRLVWAISALDGSLVPSAENVGEATSMWWSPYAEVPT